MSKKKNLSGVSDFTHIQRDDCYYGDKTMFIPDTVQFKGIVLVYADCELKAMEECVRGR